MRLPAEVYFYKRLKPIDFLSILKSLKMTAALFGIHIAVI